HTVWHVDQRALARAMLARTLWLQGFVDQANDIAQTCIEDAQAKDDTYTICFVLAFVCPIAIMIGDHAAARQSLTMLIGIGRRHGFPQWGILGRCLEGKLLIERREFANGSRLLRSALDDYDRTGWKLGCPEYLGALAEGLGELGQITEALATVGQALE